MTTNHISHVWETQTEQGKKWKPQLVEFCPSELSFVVYQSDKKAKVLFKWKLSEENTFFKIISGVTYPEKTVEHGLLLVDKNDCSFIRMSTPSDKVFKQFVIAVGDHCDCYGCFGLPIRVAVKNGGWQLPIPLYRSIQYILTDSNIESDGLFRVSAAGTDVSRVRAIFDSGKDAQLSDYSDVNVAAGIIKLYLRTLPDSLIPTALSADFLKIVRMDDDSQLEAVTAFIRSIPEPNLSILRYLFCFLTKVAEASDSNKMVSSNIAIVFAPNLLFFDDNEDGLMLSKNINDIVAKIVDNYVAIFGESPEFPGNIPAYNDDISPVNYEELLPLKKASASRKSFMPGIAFVSHTYDTH